MDWEYIGDRAVSDRLMSVGTRYYFRNIVEWRYLFFLRVVRL